MAPASPVSVPGEADPAAIASLEAIARIRLVSIHIDIVNSLSVVSVYAVLVPLAHELSVLFSGGL